MKKTKKEKTNRSFLQRIGDKRALLTIGIIVIIAVIILIAQFFQRSKNGSESEPTYSVHIVREEDPILFDGKVQAAEVQEEYYDASKGLIAEILVENGQEVEEGTDLFAYRNEENQQLLDEQNRQYDRSAQRYAEAETELANAKKTLATANGNIEESNRQAQASNEVSEEELMLSPEAEKAQNQLMEAESDKAEAEAAIEGAEMTMDELEIQMEDITYEIEKLKKEISTIIQADFKGVVELSGVDPNKLQSSEQPVVRLMSNNLKIESSVSEYDYNKLSVDSPVDIYLLNSDRELKGKISKIDSLPMQAEAEGSTSSRYHFTVLPEESIQYGFSVQIGYSEGVMYLPQNAVIEEDGKTMVYLNKDGIVEKREVVVSEKSNLYVIESGLEAEEEVLINPDPSLLDGDEVMVMYD